MTDGKSSTTRGAASGIGLVLIDAVVPVAGYYLLRAGGASQLLALLLAGLPTAVFVVHQAVRHRRIDALAIFVLTLLAAGVAVSTITGSPRFLLAKAGWFTAAIGLGFGGSLLLARPLAFTLARALLERTPMAAKLSTGAWDELWRRDRWFRRAWRVSTTMWAAGLLLDAILRLLIAYTLPIDLVPALGAALATATFLALQVIQQLYFTRIGLWRNLNRMALR